jgi:hypothetical protein
VICHACGGYVICGTGGGYVIYGAGGHCGWLGWLWCNGKIDRMPEVVLDWFGRLVVKKQRLRW